MKRHLTDASVQRLRPPRDRDDLEVFDLGYPGLALRVGYGGTKSFILFYRYAGKLRRETLGRWPETSLGAARERWRRARETIAQGDDPSLGANGKAPALAFEAVVEEWLRRDVVPRCRASSAYGVQRLVEHDLLPAWRGRRIDTIVKHDVLMLLDAIVDRGATPILLSEIRPSYRSCSVGMLETFTGMSRSLASRPRETTAQGSSPMRA